MLEQLAIQKLMNESFVELRLRNSAFSLRAYAHRLRLAPSAVSEIMRGKRKVSVKMAEKIAVKLNLSPLEKANLMALFQEKSLDPEQTNTLTKFNEKFQYLSKWYHQAILALVKTGDFVGEVDWIARRLNIKPVEATEGFRRLETLGLILRSDDGQWRENSEATVTLGTMESAHQRHLQHAIEEATLAFNRARPENSYFATQVLSIHPAQFEIVKGKVDTFLQQLAKDLVVETAPEEVARVSLQIYQISTRPNSQSSLVEVTSET